VDHVPAQQHLWVVSNLDQAQIFNLPLTPYDTATATISTGIPVLGMTGSTIDWSSGYEGQPGLYDVMPGSSVATPYASGPVSYLWIDDSTHSRVFRVRDPLGTLGLGPVVDILIGQTSVSNNTCDNFGTLSGGNCTGGLSDENQYTLGRPGALVQDHSGNLYISDYSLETAGNWRLLEYSESQIQTATLASVSQNLIQFLSASPYTGAAHVYEKNGSFAGTEQCDPAVNIITSLCRPFEAAFPSDDRAMVVQDFEQIPAVVPNPQSNFDDNNPAEPWGHLNDFYSAMYSDAFDDQDNLYTTDINRARVLVYFNPLPRPSQTPTGTVTPAPTATFTITPTPACYQAAATLASPYGGYISPDGSAVDTARNYLYAADTGNSRIQVYTYTKGTTPVPLTVFTTTYPPWALSLDGSGNLYYADYGGGLVEKIYFNGTTAANLSTIGSGLIGNPRGLYVDPAGSNVYVSSQDNYCYLLQQGAPNVYTLSATFGQTNNLGTPSGIVKVGSTVYVSDSGNNQIVAFPEIPGTPPTYGRPTTLSVGSAPLLVPGDITTDIAGNFYLESINNCLTLVFDKNFNWREQISACGSQTVDENGAIDIAESGNNQVVQFRGCEVEYTCTPTFTPTNSPSATSTFTPTSSPTWTSTITPTNTPNLSPSNTPTNSPTSTPSSTPTITPTATTTPTATDSPTPLPVTSICVPYPNPVKTAPLYICFTTAGPSDVHWKIFTLALRKIYDHDEGVVSGGTLQWNLKDQWGNQTANGLYYVRVEIGGAQPMTRILKVLVIR
jgi:sugar lactone lactonase YvrE